SHWSTSKTPSYTKSVSWQHHPEIEAGDFAALAQTAHRLKGAFAMLNLIPGKQLCETLEHLIREKDAQGIEKYISDIDAYVKSLL
ncbi:Hpt domain-containing protein, partial [Klebsiella pneumoniae]|uniref:Hpt domain-containing protein n=1 Tax=Klebsiella pneumoniae TaxID=573 RepID=UPI0030C09DF8